ncbi:MAG: hypothetical protein HY043_18685 [Verrucomicrobia bacterium]|nr:hypothetical protein [Verrucomicrobiota bacterium]
MIQFTYLPETRWLIGLGLLIAALVFASYYWAKGRSKWSRRAWLLGLRWLTIVAVIVCLLDPQWVEAIKHQQKSRVAVLLDTSRSMGSKDVPQGRLGAAKNWLQQNLSPIVPPSVAVSYYTFNQSLTPLPALDSASPTGGVTALADALEKLLAVPNDDPLTAVILCSDGIENARKDPEAVARAYRRKGIPIHTLTAGTTNDVQDIVVENVQVKRAVPNEAPTRVAVTVRAAGYRNRTVPVQIVQNKQVVAAKEVALTGGTQKIEMDFTPRQKGFQIYEASIPSQNGEWTASNNRRSFGLEVVDPTIRVIYMEGTPQQPGSPIPEWKYLKDALQSDTNIQVKVLYRKHGVGGQVLNVAKSDPETGERIYPVEHPTQGFPQTLAELLKYDVVIHSDIRKESFTPEQLQNIARLVQEFGGGFVMIGGNSAFGKGGYHRTILDRIIPVAMDQENDSQAHPFRMRVPANAWTHPLMALGATREETETIWTKKLPPFYGLNLVDRAKPGAIVLGENPNHRNGYGSAVVLAVQDIGKGRSMAFTSDTTRTWGKDFETIWGERGTASMSLNERNCDSRYYRQFWVNAVHWLAAARTRTNSPVALELANSYCLPTEQITASVKVRDKEQREISTASVMLTLSVEGKTNATFPAKFDAASRSYIAEISTPVAGNFTVMATATLKGEKLGEDKQLLVCEAVDREMAELRARPDIMANIARASGGQVVSSDAKDTAKLAYSFDSLPPATTEYHRTPLWDKGWWLAAILGLLTTEWVVRRINGMA